MKINNLIAIVEVHCILTIGHNLYFIILNLGDVGVARDISRSQTERIWVRGTRNVHLMGYIYVVHNYLLIELIY